MRFALLLPLAIIFLVSGCVPAPESGKGFTLPKGDAVQGEAVYRNLQCNACHQIEGVAQLSEGEEAPAMSVALGGEVARIKTYGELVTAVINPSHKLAPGYPEEEISEEGKSRMRNYNEVMTVSQLSDLVTFLQSKYSLIEYEPTEYPIYPYTF